MSKMLDQGLTLEEIAKKITDDENTKILEENIIPEYKCDCSKEHMGQALSTIGKEDLREIIDKDEKAELIEAVKKVSPDWVEYFTMESPVFAAKKDGKIASFCIVDENADTIISTGNNNVGMIGCVGTVPEMRRNGIGLRMVAKAMDDIKGKGCDDVFIHFTYLDWWYGRLGFKTFLHYWFGEKELNK